MFLDVLRDAGSDIIVSFILPVVINESAVGAHQIHDNCVVDLK